jgi:hypothetical protein
VSENSLTPDGAEASGDSESAVPAEEAVQIEADAPAQPKRRVGVIVAISVLSFAVLAIAAGLIAVLLQLDRALSVIDEQRQELEEQRDLIDQKETFSQAAQELMTTAAQLDGLPFATLVNTDYLRTLIERGWTHRWIPNVLEQDIADVRDETADLAALISAAADQRASNASGTFFENITDRLGSGYVSTSLDTVQASCEADAWGCVNGMKPFVIHYDQANTQSAPYMNDFLRTGLAYHEYAHVLQFTNPDQTQDALKAFDGDVETMADCYALTFLDGWKLDHTIWTSAYQYWEVSLGYGYTCNSSQRQMIRDWVASLGYQHEPISQ